MKKSKSQSNTIGKITAVVLVLLFLGLNFFKTETEGGPQEKAFAQAKLKTAQTKNPTLLAQKRNVSKLKYAYTGKWAKNDMTQKPAVDGKFAFTNPENTRNAIKATAAKKKSDKKKKKKVAKKKAKKNNKFAKSKFYSDEDDFDYEAANENYARNNRGYYRQVPQQRTPSDEASEEEKTLSIQEWITLITDTGNVSELTKQYLSGAAGQNLFYTVVEALLSSTEENIKKLGFQALEQTPSTMSLIKYSEHIDDEMSPDLKAFAQSTLQAYNQPNHLRILNASLNSQNTAVKIIAANLIRDITSKILETRAATGENVVYSEQQITSFKLLLTQSLNVINNILEAGEAESLVAASFNSARAILVQFLG